MVWMKRLYTLYKQYERFFIPAFLVGGFAVDVLTFRSVQTRTVFIVLSAYAIFAGAAILFLHNPRIYPRLETSKPLRILRTITPPALQFFFGALLSASLVFYWFSGAFSVSWPFILLIATLACGNEAFRREYLRPIVQLPIYFFTLFSLSTLIFPFVFKSISLWIFYGSGVFALAVMLAYLRDFNRFNNVKMHQRKYLTISILAIFAAMNALYFFRILPPIPLSIREAGVYHNVVHTGEDYVLTSEREHFFERLIPGQTIHIAGQQTLYVWSAVFAPSDLNTDIYNRWEIYDKGGREWEERGRFSYALSGGRKEGYRGYSYKTAIEPGRWRVSLETQRGQVLGRVKFRVEMIEEAPELMELVK
ncbi:hypothetical protein A3D69_03150 [Candidatus Uhrbacteria bacterium RIFCSPHIGHO2_02_FULL_54_11]|nr:MAG: hypothetical protein A3D69_03150 [Candidatus Uhrbacteria bacterium RIFCSPHIGHO2_02_FULL_54_11]